MSVKISLMLLVVTLFLIISVSAVSLTPSNLLDTAEKNGLTVLGNQTQLSFNDSTLINAYKFENNSFDYSSSRDDLTFTGAPEYVTGYVGLGLNLSGSTQNAYAVQSTDIYNSAMTIMFWFKADTNNRALFSIGGSSTDGSPEMLIRYASDNTVVVFHKSNGASLGYSTGAASISTGQWYLYTLTYDGVSNFTQYINGTFDVSFNGSFAYAQPNIYIGSGYNDYFGGIIDEVFIFNRTLTSSEINDTRDNGISGYELNGDLKLRQFNISSGNSAITITTSPTTPAGTGITERIGAWDGIDYSSPLGIYAHFSFDSLIEGVANEVVDRIQGFLGSRNSTASSIYDDKILNRGVNFDGADDYLVINHTGTIFADGETQALWEKSDLNPILGLGEAKSFGSVWYDGDTEEYIIIAPDQTGEIVRQNSTDGLSWGSPVDVLLPIAETWETRFQVSNTLKEENLALKFNTTNYAEVALPQVTYNQTWAASLWINFDSIADGNIFSIGDTSTDGTPQTLMRMNSGNITTYIKAGVTGYKEFDYIFSADTWYHIIIQHETDNQTLFVNGTEIFTVEGYDPYDGADNLFIGFGFSGNSQLNGTIDEFRFYNRTLNSTEIEDIYNNEKIERDHLTRDGLVLWFPINDNSTTSLNDRSDSNSDATLNSMDFSLWENADKWYMLYRSYNATQSPYYQVGLATSDDSYTWARYKNNPLNDSITGVQGNIDPMSGIRINDTYYFFMNGDGGHGITNLLTTHDFIEWENDSRNPIFWDEQYCGFVWYDPVSEYYYMLLPYDNGNEGETFLYSHDIQLFRSKNVTFYPEEREYLGIAVANDKDYDNKYLDTPSLFMTDVYRNVSVKGDEIWGYYNADSTDYANSNSFFNTTQTFLNSLSEIEHDGRLYNQNQTVCMWVNPSDSRAATEWFFGIDRKLDGAEWANEPQIVWGLSSADKQAMFARNGNSNVFLAGSNSAVAQNQWSLLCYEFVRNESNLLESSFRFWKDGNTDSDWQTGSFAFRHPQYIYVGAAYDTYFNGSVDDLVIYNRNLNSTEHKDLYMRGLAEVAHSSWNEASSEGNEYSLPSDTTYIFPEYIFSTTDSTETPVLDFSSYQYSLTATEADLSPSGPSGGGFWTTNLSEGLNLSGNDTGFVPPVNQTIKEGILDRVNSLVDKLPSNNILIIILFWTALSLSIYYLVLKKTNVRRYT